MYIPYHKHIILLYFTAALKSWGVFDGDLFYAVPRLKRQPGIKEFVSLPELDHNIGEVLSALCKIDDITFIQVRKLSILKHHSMAHFQLMHIWTVILQKI